MSKLEQELEAGKAAALSLVQHLDLMGAGEAKLPVSYNDREYEVSVVMVDGGAPTRAELEEALIRTQIESQENYEQGIQRGRLEATQ